jgi:hypothetical protein
MIIVTNVSIILITRGIFKNIFTAIAFNNQLSIHFEKSNLATKSQKHQISPKLNFLLLGFGVFWRLGVLVAFSFLYPRPIVPKIPIVPYYCVQHFCMNQLQRAPAKPNKQSYNKNVIFLFR